MTLLTSAYKKVVDRTSRYLRFLTSILAYLKGFEHYVMGERAQDTGMNIGLFSI